VKWGGTDLKWGVGHHWPPAGDDPGCEHPPVENRWLIATLFIGRAEYFVRL